MADATRAEAIAERVRLIEAEREGTPAKELTIQERRAAIRERRQRQ